MLPNAFIGAVRKPTAKELSLGALGEADPVWDQLVKELARLEVNGLEWRSYSPEAGWALRLKRKQRTIVWLAPSPGSPPRGLHPGRQGG